MRCAEGSHAGLTLVELVLVIVVSAIVLLAVPALLSRGVQTMVYLPRATATNEVALELLHQLVEGGFSTLQPTPLRGLRFSARTLPQADTAASPAIWLAETSCLGYRTAENQLIFVRLDGTVVRRGLPASSACPPPPRCAATLSPTEEILPYHAQQQTRPVDVVAPALFRYYDANGTAVATGCPASGSIRRVDIEFTAQTGSGSFDQGDAQESIRTLVAIRVP